MMGEAQNRGTVAVAMSGGVDSSTAACLLAEQGFKVIGITLKLFCYSGQSDSERSCCNLKAIADARSVCDRIGAPHYVLGAEAEFRKQVIDRFVDTYLDGRTPNPCVDCNTYIKFHFLLEKARRLGADHLATGHYARLVTGEQSDAGSAAEPRLARGADPEKAATACGFPTRWKVRKSASWKAGVSNSISAAIKSKRGPATIPGSSPAKSSTAAAASLASTAAPLSTRSASARALACLSAGRPTSRAWILPPAGSCWVPRTSC